MVEIVDWNITILISAG